MKTKCRHKGFSLTEVMMAVGILAVGMIFIGGVFPVALHFSTVATERTTAAVVADEAFAKIQLYNINFASLMWPANPTIECVDFDDVSFAPLDPDEFAYPSVPPPAINSAKQYWWSAVCRRTEPEAISRSVQVTVFVCRKTATGNNYWDRDPLTGEFGFSDRPVPVRVDVDAFTTANPAELRIDDSDLLDDIDEINFINDGCTIVDNATGRMYRVLERYADQPNVILLDGPWQVTASARDAVWVVPPPVGGGRYPCIAVYQKLIQF